jgi:hypothetical protein
MQRFPDIHRFLIAIIIISANIVLASCSRSTQTVTPTSTEIILPPTPTQTTVPSETPQPPLVVLLAPPSSDPVISENLQNKLTDLAAQAGLRFQVVQSMAVTDFSSQAIKLAFVLPPDPGIGEIATTAPQTQFVAIGITGVQPGVNISVIGSTSSHPDQAGFLAGVIGAVITDDFRVGVIYPAEMAVGKAARRGFSKGVSYYCGLCQPVHPPYPPSNYPLFYELPASAGQADWEAAVAYFNEWQAKTVYITPDLTDEGLSEYLANAGFMIISQADPGDDYKDRWIVSIGGGDLVQTVETHWTDFLSGKGGLSIELPLGLSYVNEAIISPGKLQFLNNVLTDLQTDFIDTGVDPVTGEWR